MRNENTDRTGFKARVSRRSALVLTSAALAGAVLPAAAAGAPADDSWVESAVQLGETPLAAVLRHPFVSGVFAGTLAKGPFVLFLQQNLIYLAHYAAVLETLAGRLVRERGLKGESEAFAAWAQETLDMRDWTASYVKDLEGEIPQNAAAIGALQSYVDFEEACAQGESLAAAVAAVLPCFWLWDAFGRKLRPGAKIDGNPFRAWVEGMGSEAAHASCIKILAVAESLARDASLEEKARMTDVFLAGCWHEWSLFEAVLRR